MFFDGSCACIQNMKPSFFPPPFHPRSTRVNIYVYIYSLYLDKSVSILSNDILLALTWQCLDFMILNVTIIFFYKLSLKPYFEILVILFLKEENLPEIFNFPSLKMWFSLIMKWEIRFYHFNFEALLPFPRVLFIFLSVCNLLQYE